MFKQFNPFYRRFHHRRAKFMMKVHNDCIKKKLIKRILFKSVISNEFYNDWKEWLNYRERICKNQIKDTNLSLEYIECSTIYGIAFNITYSQIRANVLNINKLQDTNNIYEINSNNFINSIRPIYLSKQEIDRTNLRLEEYYFIEYYR